jgi:hypothetical protein
MLYFGRHLQQGFKPRGRVAWQPSDCLSFQAYLFSRYDYPSQASR